MTGIEITLILVGIVALAVIVIIFVWEGWISFLRQYLHGIWVQAFRSASVSAGGRWL